MVETYVGYLHGVLVGLNNLGTLTAELYYEGCVYGKLYYSGQIDSVCIDLETGLVRRLTQCGNSSFADSDDEPQKLGFKVKYALKLDVEPVVIQDDVLTKLVSTMLTHRVSGEKIIQGLKLDKINISVKLVENYLGGWSVSLKSDNDDEIPGIPWDISVNHFIGQICALLLRKE